MKKGRVIVPRKMSILLLVLITLAASACTQPVTVKPPADESVQGSAGESVELAVRFLDLTSITVTLPAPQAPTPVPTPTRRPTPLPSPTILAVTGTTEANAVASPSPTACKNSAEIVKHLTVSPNTMFHGGDSFAKVWLVRNIGTCTWTTGYSFLFVGGYLLDALQQEIFLPHPVSPTETVELRVQMFAPQIPNTYVSSWMLRDDAGNLFGIGEFSDLTFDVIIGIIPPSRITPP